MKLRSSLIKGFQTPEGEEEELFSSPSTSSPTTAITKGPDLPCFKYDFLKNIFCLFIFIREKK